MLGKLKKETPIHFPHRCSCSSFYSPGRFFAANEIKLMLSRILLDYDIKMPDGFSERYPNLAMGLDALPDPTKNLMLKRVKASA